MGTKKIWGQTKEPAYSVDGGTQVYFLEQVSVVTWIGVIVLGQHSSTVLLHEGLWSGSSEEFRAMPMEIN